MIDQMEIDTSRFKVHEMITVMVHLGSDPGGLVVNSVISTRTKLEKDVEKCSSPLFSEYLVFVFIRVLVLFLTFELRTLVNRTFLWDY